jgi:hypothetical protein
MSYRLGVLLFGGLIILTSQPSCRKRTEDAQRKENESQLIQRKSPVGSTKLAGAKAEHALQPFARLGIPECDGYLVKYRACIASRVPSSERAVLLDSLNKTAQAWRQAAETDSGRTQLKAACEMAYAAARAVMKDYGCAW